MFKFSSGGLSGLHPSLYDIRIQSEVKNSLIVRGKPEEASSIILSGHVVFAIPERITLKKLTLNLSGVYKLEFLESSKDEKSINKVVKQETQILTCNWDNLLTDSEGFLSKGTYKHNQRFPKHTNLEEIVQPASPDEGRITHSRKKNLNKSKAGKSKLLIVDYSDVAAITGETPFPDYFQIDQARFSLPTGNYSVPFQVVLPGNVPETIEGLQCGAVLYRFESRMEGEKVSKSLPVSTKYLRIFRLPLPSDYSLFEDCSMENSWPNKAEYEVKLPRRSVPIGGFMKIHILIIPLLKHLKLGKISATITQYFVLKNQKGELFEDEKTIYKCDLPDVSMDSLSEDRWSLEAKLFLPSRLKQCSPDATLREDMLRIRHKLNLSVELINPDGHTSLINSKLPLVLYISGKNSILGRNAYIDPAGRVRFMKGDTPIFEDNQSNVSNVSNAIISPTVDGLGEQSNDSNAQQQQQPPNVPDPSERPSESSLDPPATNTTRGITQDHNSHHRHHHRGTIQIDDDYEFGNDLEDEDFADPYPEQYLPSYKDSEKDILFTPEIASGLQSPSGYFSPSLIFGSQTPLRGIDSSGLDSGQQTPSYFDMVPAYRTQESTLGITSPAIQLLSRVNSRTMSQSPVAFDDSINNIPEYNQVYDEEALEEMELAPLYEPINGISSKAFADYLMNRVLESQVRKDNPDTGDGSSTSFSANSANTVKAKAIPVARPNTAPAQPSSIISLPRPSSFISDRMHSRKSNTSVRSTSSPLSPSFPGFFKSKSSGSLFKHTKGPK